MSGNLESRKIKYCFGKGLEKVLNFGSKNLYLCEPCLQNVEIRRSGDVFNASTYKCFLNIVLIQKMHHKPFLLLLFFSFSSFCSEMKSWLKVN